MGYKLALAGQKGGVGKSAIARALAVVATEAGLETKIADLDTKQLTAVNWTRRRAENGIKPDIRVEAFASVDTALRDSRDFDMYIFDTAGESSSLTYEAAAAADLIVIPTNEGFDDLDPSIILANNLTKKKNIPIGNIVFALFKTTGSAVEVEKAREYLNNTPYAVLPGDVPVKSSLLQSLDKGRALNEVQYASLRNRVNTMAQGIIDLLVELTEAKEVELENC